MEEQRRRSRRRRRRRRWPGLVLLVVVLAAAGAVLWKQFGPERWYTAAELGIPELKSDVDADGDHLVIEDGEDK